MDRTQLRSTWVGMSGPEEERVGRLELMDVVWLERAGVPDERRVIVNGLVAPKLARVNVLRAVAVGLDHVDRQPAGVDGGQRAVDPEPAPGREVHHDQSDLLATGQVVKRVFGIGCSGDHQRRRRSVREEAG